MRRYRSTQPPEGARLVHNFPPGPPDDPGRDRAYGLDGFRYWVTDEMGNDERCFCGWLDGREHYGTRYLDAAGRLHWPPQFPIEMPQMMSCPDCGELLPLCEPPIVCACGWRREASELGWPEEEFTGEDS